MKCVYIMALLAIVLIIWLMQMLFVLYGFIVLIRYIESEEFRTRIDNNTVLASVSAV